MQIVLSPKAAQTMDNYFEDYVGSQNENDMNQRAYNYSRIFKMSVSNKYHGDLCCCRQELY